MRRRWFVLASCVTLAMVIASLSSTRLPQQPVDPAVSLDAVAGMPAAVRATLRHACFDCHSDETRWPWYASLPVASWLVVRDVREGRGQLNFSRWLGYNALDRADLLDRACELVRARTMPLWQYRLVHRDARLTDAEIAVLCAWTHAESARLTGEGR